METGIEDIYAVGDAVQVSHLVTGDDALISLAGPANKQGRVAADVICGLRQPLRRRPGHAPSSRCST